MKALKGRANPCRNRGLGLERPFRACWNGVACPRALPWAGIGSPFRGLLKSVRVPPRRYPRLELNCYLRARAARAGEPASASWLRSEISLSGACGSRSMRRRAACARLTRCTFWDSAFNAGGAGRALETAVLLSAKAERRLRTTVREMTPPNWGRSLAACMKDLSRYPNGWVPHFRLCTAQAVRALQVIDAQIRRRLRAIIIRQRKRPPFPLPAPEVPTAVRRPTGRRIPLAADAPDWIGGTRD
jgi:hypothetical protein